MGLEHRVRGASAFPIWVEALGGLMIAACLVSSGETFRENSYASSVVEVQADRGHKVISTGLYGVVRHPMYAGALLFKLGVPLLLGSAWGLPPAVLGILAIAWRALGEERLLARELAGYADYMAKVRWRFVPGVW